MVSGTGDTVNPSALKAIPDPVLSAVTMPRYVAVVPDAADDCHIELSAASDLTMTASGVNPSPEIERRRYRNSHLP